MNAWRVFITSAAERAMRSLPQGVKDFVCVEFPRLVKDNPFIGEQLAGPLSWLRSFHFRVAGKPYRIAYSVDEKERRIVVHYADYRGDFYERLRRLLNH